jgi:periplasmic divalent cation tolerance protein
MRLPPAETGMSSIFYERRILDGPPGGGRGLNRIKALTSPMEPVVVLSTAPRDLAGSIADMLVESGLAACVNIAEVHSCFIWDGEVCHDEEALLIIKTFRERMHEVIATVRARHPYEVPEIIAIPITGGFEDYFSWMRMVAGTRST